MSVRLIGISGILLLAVVAPRPSPLAGQEGADCEGCITQWTGEVAEHWFGNRPDDEEWDASNAHDNPEPGTCDDTSPVTGDPYHARCDQLAQEEQEDLQAALMALERKEFRLIDVWSVKEVVEAIGSTLVVDGATGQILVVGCSGAVVGSVQVRSDRMSEIGRIFYGPAEG